MMKRILILTWAAILSINLNAQTRVTNFPNHPFDYYRTINRYSDQMLQGLNRLFVAFGKAPVEEQEKMLNSIVSGYQQMMPQVLMLEPWKGSLPTDRPDSALVISLRKYFHRMGTEVIPELEAMKGNMFTYPSEQVFLEQLTPIQQDVYTRLMRVNQVTREASEAYPENHTQFITAHEAAFNTYFCDKLAYLMERMAVGMPDTSSRYWDAVPQLEGLTRFSYKMIYNFGFGPKEALPQVKPQFDHLAQAWLQCNANVYSCEKVELTTGHAYRFRKKSVSWGQGPTAYLYLFEPRAGQGLLFRVEIYN
jgi:hypothetical protein